MITVKAPPNPSKKHQETNCCAGIDLETGNLIRLYPIPFRLLDDSKKFPKYSIIKVKCKKPIRDKRIESYEVDQDSIKILNHLDTKNNWAERKEVVLPAVSSSFCEIWKDAKKKSLGIFQPTEIDFEFRPASKTKTKLHAAYNQLFLFDKKLKLAEQIPYRFYYKFKCNDDANCSGHNLLIHDWELTEAYRNWRHNYENKEALLDKIKETWLDNICGPKKDIYFFVGNMWRQPKRFMVLGVFYPPKSPPVLFKH